MELGSTEILKLLIDAGADFKATAGGGMTALRLAAMTGKNDMVEMLVKAGAFNVRNFPKQNLRLINIFRLIE